MDASIHPGFFFWASVLYAGVAAVVFLIYLRWLAAIRRNHAGEEHRPWLQYVGATIVIAVIVVILQIGPFLGMLPTLLVVKFVPDKLRYHLLATGAYFCILFGITITTRTIDPMGMPKIERMTYPISSTEEYLPFASEAVNFPDGSTIKIPTLNGYEMKATTRQDEKFKTLKYSLYRGGDMAIGISLNEPRDLEFRNLSIEEIKALIYKSIAGDRQIEFMEMIKKAYRKSENDQISFGKMPTVLQESQKSLLITCSLIENGNRSIGGYHGVLIICEEKYLIFGYTYLGHDEHIPLFLNIFNNIIDINQK